MEFRLLGWAAEGPTLDLDHRQFAYAGKFVMSTTGKAVLVDDEEAIVAAVAFNEDRTDPSTAWLRYVTVRQDSRGKGYGPRLCQQVTVRLHDKGYDRVRIAVNNPIAYEALYRAGFGYSGDETGIAELVLEHPGNREPERYRSGYDIFANRDLSEAETAVLERHREGVPPAVLDPAD